MSAINGDKARFHRDRKHRIERRERYRKLFGNVAKDPGHASGGNKAAARKP